MVCVCSSAVLSMASVLQKLITPLFSGPLEPPRNKVTVVGVGQVGMACAVSVLLRVRRARRAVIDRDRLYSPFANMLRTLRPQHKHIPGQNPCWFIDCTQGYEHFAHTDDVSKSVGH